MPINKIAEQTDIGACKPTERLNHIICSVIRSTLVMIFSNIVYVQISSIPKTWSCYTCQVFS